MHKKKILLIALIILLFTLIVGCSQMKDVKNAPYIALDDTILNEHEYNDQYIHNMYYLYKDKLIYSTYSDKHLFSSRQELQFWCVDKNGGRLILNDLYYSDILLSDVYVDSNINISYDKVFFIAIGADGTVLSEYDLNNDTFNEIAVIDSEYHVKEWRFSDNKVYFLDTSYADNESNLCYYDLKSEKYTEVSSDVQCYNVMPTGDIMYVANGNDDTFRVCLYNPLSNTSKEVYRSEYDKYTTNGFSLIDNYVILESGAFTSKFCAHNLSTGEINCWNTDFLASDWVYFSKYAYVLVNSDLDVDSEKYGICQYEIATGKCTVIVENIGMVCDIQVVNEDTIYAFVIDGDTTKLYRIMSNGKKEEVYSFKE